jgi:restriction system protein
MRKFYRVMLGKQSMYAEDCLRDGFIGASYGIKEDLAPYFSEDWREFNKKLIPVYLTTNPGKTKVAAGLSCGALWSISQGMKVGDIIISPNGKGRYAVGEVTSDYMFRPEQNQQHQRSVLWKDLLIDKADVSTEFQNSVAAMRSIISLEKYASELETLIGVAKSPQVIVSTDETIEDPTVFALERHLEDFLVHNWAQTPLGRDYDIYQDEENTGRQFQTDTGFIDILAVSKDRQELLVVELKKGRASDAVVGQIQRYMGFIAEDIAEEHQRVRGVIIALEDDLRIRRALKVALNIEFYRYEVKFDLIKS